MIDGVRVRPAITHPDNRGTVCEIVSDDWDDKPLVHVYEITIRPGVIKGWVKHDLQDDRLFMAAGSLRVVLYDDREDSPTRGLVTSSASTTTPERSCRSPPVSGTLSRTSGSRTRR